MRIVNGTHFSHHALGGGAWSSSSWRPLPTRAKMPKDCPHCCLSVMLCGSVLSVLALVYRIAAAEMQPPITPKNRDYFSALLQLNSDN